MYFMNLLAALYPRSGEESEILRQIARGDETALARLYDRYSGILYGFIFSIVHKQAEAEDVLQEIFLQVWEKASLFDAARGDAYTWLVTLARHRAIDRTRSKQFRAQSRTDEGPGLDLLPAPGGNSPLDATVMNERASIVRSAMELLPPEQKEVIQISYFGGLSQSEIAERLNVPLGTVKTRMRQAMIKLQRQLKEQI